MPRGRRRAVEGGGGQRELPLDRRIVDNVVVDNVVVDTVDGDGLLAESIASRIVVLVLVSGALRCVTVDGRTQIPADTRTASEHSVSAPPPQSAEGDLGTDCVVDVPVSGLLPAPSTGDRVTQDGQRDVRLVHGDGHAATGGQPQP